MVDGRPGGRALRRRATPRGSGTSLIKDRFRHATRGGGASYALAVLHQVIALLETVKELADLIGPRVETAHHLALLCQLVFTLLQGKHVQKQRIYVRTRRRESGNPSLIPPWDMRSRRD